MPLPIREGKQTGADTSKWQFNRAYTPMVDYQLMADYGIRFVIARAGVGEHYVDPKFAETVVGCRGVGIEVMAYHVFEPDARVGVSDQIRHLGRIIGPHEIKAVRGDFELPWKGVVDVVDLRDRVYEYLMRARDLVGTPPTVTAGREENQGIYTANWWWSGPLNHRVLPKDTPAYGDNQPWSNDDNPLIRANGHSLWMADYGANNGDVPARMAILPAGWRPSDDGTGQFAGKWSIWQFTSRGKVPGVHANIDLNLMRDEVFEDLFGVEPPPPLPPNGNGDIPPTVLSGKFTFTGEGSMMAAE